MTMRLKHTLAYSGLELRYRSVTTCVSCLVFWDRVELSDAGDASVVLTH